MSYQWAVGSDWLETATLEQVFMLPQCSDRPNSIRNLPLYSYFARRKEMSVLDSYLNILLMSVCSSGKFITEVLLRNSLCTPTLSHITKLLSSANKASFRQPAWTLMDKQTESKGRQHELIKANKRSRIVKNILLKHWKPLKSCSITRAVY